MAVLSGVVIGGYVDGDGDVGGYGDGEGAWMAMVRGRRRCEELLVAERESCVRGGLISEILLSLYF